MSGPATFFQLLGGIALLLWGLQTVQSGMTRAYGSSMRVLLSRLMSRRLGGFAAGLVATVVLQSSTATALLVSSLAGQGMLQGTGGIAAMLGADVGSALVAQIFTLGLIGIAPLLAVVGVVMYMSFRRDWGRYSGRAIVGLAIILFALGLITDSTRPLRESELATMLLSSFADDPILALLAGFFLTWLAHSSLAPVLLVGALVGGELIGLELGLVFILGINVGNAMPAIVYTWRKSPLVRRIPLANLMFRTTGAVLAMPLIAQLSGIATSISDVPLQQVINTHLLYNLLLVAVFLPFVGRIERLMRRLMPDPAATGKIPSQPHHLDPEALANPPAAVLLAEEDTLTMSRWIRQILRDIQRAERLADRGLIEDVRVKEEIVNDFYRLIVAYLPELNSAEMGPEESRRSVETLSFVHNLENIGDVVKSSMCDRILRMIGSGVRLPPSERGMLDKMYREISSNLKLAVEVYQHGGVEDARDLLSRKIKLATHEQRVTSGHLHSLPASSNRIVEASSYFLDTMGDLKRINSYLSTVAYPIVDKAGLLRQSRLRSEPRDERDRQAQDGDREGGRQQ